jgi:hypothetical protein
MRTTLIVISACLISFAYGWCDPGLFQCAKGATGCQHDDCLCLPGWRSTFPITNNCEPICGDKIAVGSEQCDGGVGCCGCRCKNGFVPTNPPSKDCVPVGTPLPVVAPVTTPVQPPSSCKYRTYTKNGWQGACEGVNTACYRDNHFDTCFDLGLVIGLPGCSYVNLTTAFSIRNLLPTIGLSLDLNGLLSGLPFSEVRGSLSAQLIAAQLNIGFDSCDDDFSSCEKNLVDLCFKAQANIWAGHTIGQTIQAAQCIIGGCADSCTSKGLPAALCALSHTDILSCLTDFNEAFDGGLSVAVNAKVGECSSASLDSDPGRTSPEDNIVSSAVVVSVGSAALLAVTAALF